MNITEPLTTTTAHLSTPQTSTLSYRDVRARSLKPCDSIAEVVLNDTITAPITYLVYRFLPSLTGLHFTLLSFVLRMSSAVAFASGALCPGALLAYAGFITDGIDGKLSRAHNGHDPEVRGTADFVLDQLSFASMSVAMLFHSLQAGDSGWAFVLGLWLMLSYVGTSLTSTRYRLLAKSNGQIATRVLDSGQHAGALHTLLKLARNANDRLSAILKPLRVSPQLTTVESEVLLYMVAPLLGMPLWLGIAALVPLILTIAIFAGAVFLLAPNAESGTEWK